MAGPSGRVGTVTFTAPSASDTTAVASQSNGGTTHVGIYSETCVLRTPLD